MSRLRVGQAADLLATSPDTVRRMLDRAELAGGRTPGGQRFVDGAALARYLAGRSDDPFAEPGGPTRSARNRFTGLITDVAVEGIVARVEIAVGRHRVVSVVTAEAVAELGLVVGMIATASVKATSVVVEVPRGERPVVP